MYTRIYYTIIQIVAAIRQGIVGYLQFVCPMQWSIMPPQFGVTQGIRALCPVSRATSSCAPSRRSRALLHKMKHVTRLATLHSEMILGGGSARQPPFAAPVAGSVKTEVAAWCAIMGV